MPFYLQALFAVAMLIAIFSLIVEICNRYFRSLRKPSKTRYLLTKEALEDNVVIYTLEIYREGIFKWLEGQTILLKRTFDEPEAQRWAEMFGIEIEDIDAE